MQPVGICVRSELHTHVLAGARTAAAAKSPQSNTNKILKLCCGELAVLLDFCAASIKSLYSVTGRQ
jgi:hypothetical protein